MRALLLAAFLLAACEGADAAGSDASALPEDAALADASTPPRDAASAGLDAGRPEDASASEDGGDPCSRPGVQTIVALAASPALVKIARGAQIDLTLLATFSSGCVKEVTSVYLASSDPAVAAVDVSALAVVVRGLANGSAILQASTQQGGQGVVSNDVAVTVEDPTTPPPTETRALWITRFAYREDPTDGAADIRGIIDRAKAAHFNTLFLQVRGAGDAYYQSTLEPSWGGGKGLGEDPGWDPLRVGLEYAHQQGMQLHAYLNAMSGWTKSAGAIPDTTPPHVLRAHPELTCRDSAGSDSADGEYIYLAADPAYRAHLADVVEDVITHYAVDGIHLDRIRTPGPDYCHSPALDLAFQQEGGSWADFSRRQIDETVKAIHERMLARDPQLVLSAAVW
ncbi:MAG: family 10 glycosylhydrolase, partial [Deltaproteobacteria bacterium]|nr:family 10 glycosylhydrolase [Deltaproteobacteria bacterium]